MFSPLPLTGTKTAVLEALMSALYYCSEFYSTYRGGTISAAARAFTTACLVSSKIVLSQFTESLRHCFPDGDIRITSLTNSHFVDHVQTRCLEFPQKLKDGRWLALTGIWRDDEYRMVGALLGF